MLKQIWICECDICNKIARAVIKFGRHNNKKASILDGWCYGYNHKIHICPECAKRIISAQKNIFREIKELIKN